MATAKTATILTRTEPETKAAADELFNRLGMTTSGAINIFLHRALKTGGLPFRVTEAKPDIPDMDEMTKEEVLALLDESSKQIDDGKTIPIDQAFSRLRAKYGF